MFASQNVIWRDFCNRQVALTLGKYLRVVLGSGQLRAPLVRQSQCCALGSSCRALP